MNDRYTCKQCGAEFGRRTATGEDLKCPNCRSSEVDVASVLDATARIQVSDSPIYADEIGLAPEPEVESSPIHREPLPSESAGSDRATAARVDWSWASELEGDTEYQLTAPKATSPCPGCGRELATTAVVCLSCGFNRDLNQKMQTQIERPVVKAALTEADDIRVEPMDTATIIFGVGGLVAFLIGGLIYFASPLVFALLAMGLGFVLFNVGYWWVVLIAFEDDVVKGVLALLINAYAVVYFIMNWEACKSAAYFLLTGMVIGATGLTVLSSL